MTTVGSLSLPAVPAARPVPELASVNSRVTPFRSNHVSGGKVT